MAGKTVTGDQYMQVDRRMTEIKRQLTQFSGSSLDIQLVLDSLQRLVESSKSHLSAIRTIVDPESTLAQLSEQGYLNHQAVTMLAQYGIKTLDDLTHYTEAQVSEMRLVGARRFGAIKLLMGDAGLKFRTTREDDEWRTLRGGQIRLSQLLTLSVTDVYEWGTGRATGMYHNIARTFGATTFADFAAIGREAVENSREWGSYNERYIDGIFDPIEIPA